MTKDINYLIKKYWKEIYYKKRNFASNKATHFLIEIELPDNNRQKLVVLYEKLKDISNEIGSGSLIQQSFPSR